MLGIDNGGKTTLFYYLIGEDNKHAYPGGPNIASILVGGLKLNLYDIPGQKNCRLYWNYYYGLADALIFVVDASDGDRIGECNEVVQELLEEEKLAKVPICFFGNKADLPDCLGPDETIDGLKLEDIVGRDWSALKGIGVTDGIRWLFQKLSR